MTEMFLHGELTDGIIRCFYKVYNKLGYGFLEKVYENALKIELEKLGFIPYPINPKHPFHPRHPRSIIIL